MAEKASEVRSVKSGIVFTAIRLQEAFSKYEIPTVLTLLGASNAGVLPRLRPALGAPDARRLAARVLDQSEMSIEAT